MSFETGLPYVMAIHDLQHRLQPEFPEVSAGGEWERREYLYRNAVRRATTLIADSEVGREDILSCYGEVGAVPDRIEVLPFLPAPYLAREPTQEERLEVRRRYRLPERYLYYPAQFWPHKNHLRIVEALSRLQPLQVHVVLSGTATDRLRRRTLATAMEAATRLGVERQIHYLGYVADAEMSSLYAESSGLVFPTFFGPTNIPILEAWATGRPVLTSDIRGVREQVGDAAVLADPRSVDAIGEGMRQLWQDPALCAGLVEKGRVRLSRYTREDYSRRLLAILREALDRASLRGMGTACSV
jgi:glycosyltransferase involved in cell wall biosynthesis